MALGIVVCPFLLSAESIGITSLHFTECNARPGIGAGVTPKRLRLFGEISQNTWCPGRELKYGEILITGKLLILRHSAYAGKSHYGKSLYKIVYKKRETKNNYIISSAPARRQL